MGIIESMLGPTHNMIVERVLVGENPGDGSTPIYFGICGGTQTMALGNFPKKYYELQGLTEHGDVLQYTFTPASGTSGRASLSLEKSLVAKSQYKAETGHDPVLSAPDPCIAVRYQLCTTGNIQNTVHGYIHPLVMKSYKEISVHSPEFDRLASWWSASP